MTSEIPVEAQVRIACSLFFAALERGDYSVAGRLQRNISDLGWYVGPECRRTRRRQSEGTK